MTRIRSSVFFTLILLVPSLVHGGSRELLISAIENRLEQNKEIALELTISERTVKFHVSSLMGKLGAGNRTEAVMLAAQRGLIEL